MINHPLDKLHAELMNIQYRVSSLSREYREIRGLVAASIALDQARDDVMHKIHYAPTTGDKCKA